MPKYKTVLLATGPFHTPALLSARRAVLKAIYLIPNGEEHGTISEFIVHTEYVNETGQTSFTNGEYVVIRDRPISGVWNYVWERFAKRCIEFQNDPLANIYADPERFKNYIPLLETKGKG
jgi:hypothetical protein